MKLQDFLFMFTRNSRAVGGGGGAQSLISSCGRDLINELDGYRDLSVNPPCVPYDWGHLGTSG